jgi:beta-lactamase superfamily II metal-dependent hydrolase
MKIEIFPSLSGDCLLITSRDDKRILADAGLPAAYSGHIAAPLSRLRKTGKAIDLAYVSHIDRDHIGGILRLLDDEMAWRVHDHMQKKGKSFKKPKAPRPPDILEIWHNAFLEDIEATRGIALGSALASSAETLGSLNAAGLGNREMTASFERVQMLALSVGDAIEVNWRIGKDQLGIPLNTPSKRKDKFLVARPKATIPLGSMDITVLGPTKVELEELRTEWIAWLEAKEKSGTLNKMRARRERDVDKLQSGSPAAIAEAAQAVTLEVEGDVTPPNLASLVLLVEENGKRLLLTGDAGDETLLGYLSAADLFDKDKPLAVDVLKVPHHGAHNSYSDIFVERVRANHYVFCGDGEHDNPEIDVVDGYLRGVAANPHPSKKAPTFWFNCSSSRCEAKYRKHWRTIEAMFGPSGVAPKAKARFIGDSAASLRLTLT